MLRAFVYKLYPNKEQSIYLNKNMGCHRFMYNYFLNFTWENYEKQLNEKVEKPKYLSSYEFITTKLASIKKEYPWLVESEIISQSLNETIINAGESVKSFMKGKKGKPKFKAKSKHKTVKIHSNNDSIKCRYKEDNDRVGYIKLPKLSSEIKFKVGKGSKNRLKDHYQIKNVTIKLDNTGEYSMSVLVDTKKPVPVKTTNVTIENSVGIDMGLKTLMVLSNGKEYSNEQFFCKQLNKLAREQRSLSRKTKGSKNYRKQVGKVAKIHKKIKRQRQDYYHKITTEIVNENQGAIIVENLDIRGMLSRKPKVKSKKDDDGKVIKVKARSNHNQKTLNRMISDAAWNTIVRMLEYKCVLNGREFIKVDRYYPSSKLCSNCGFKNTNLTLKDREWKCKSCKQLHDRDLNASINVLNRGLEIYNSGQGMSGVPVENPKDHLNYDGQDSMKQECSIKNTPTVF